MQCDLSSSTRNVLVLESNCCEVNACRNPRIHRKPELFASKLAEWLPASWQPYSFDVNEVAQDECLFPVTNVLQSRPNLNGDGWFCGSSLVFMVKSCLKYIFLNNDKFVNFITVCSLPDRVGKSVCDRFFLTKSTWQATL